MSKIVVIKITGENRVEPETPPLSAGDQVQWDNHTDDAYEIKFAKGSPFEDSVADYDIRPRGSVLSRPIIPGKGRFLYQVSPTQRSRGERFAQRGPVMEPTIIVNAPITS